MLGHGTCFCLQDECIAEHCGPSVTVQSHLSDRVWTSRSITITAKATSLATFNFTNLGCDWSLNWVSYLTVDGSNDVTVRRARRWLLRFIAIHILALPDVISQAEMTNLGGGSYQRQLPDGSVENFTLSDGTNIYMTSVVDPQGNAATISYDSHYRVTGVSDACGNPQHDF